MVGRNVVRSLVQPPAQRGVGCWLGPGYSGLYPLRFWKPQRMETSQPSSTTFSNTSLSQLWTDVSVYAAWTSLASTYVYCLCVPPWNTLGTRLCFPCSLLAGAGGLWFVSPKLCFFQAKQASFTQSVLIGHVLASWCLMICTIPCLSVALPRAQAWCIKTEGSLFFRRFCVLFCFSLFFSASCLFNHSMYFLLFIFCFKQHLIMHLLYRRCVVPTLELVEDMPDEWMDS